MAKAGKINLDFFKQNISEKCGFQRPEILMEPKFGVDVSVVDLGSEQILISASDPMSFIPGLGAKDSAWLSVVLTSNDIATSGYSPQFAQVVLNLPDTMSGEEFTDYWDSIHHYCNELQISIVGGHTGFVPGQNSTFAGGITMFAVGEKGKYFTSANAQEGDLIVMTKSAAMISTAILAKSFPETVKEHFGEEFWLKTSSKFEQTSVLKEALIAANSEGVNAMHDVTEGGILGAVYEMMQASDKGFEIDESKIIIDEETRKMSELFGYDAFRSVGAGSLIITVKSDFAESLLTELHSENISCAVIGTVKEKNSGNRIISEHEIKEYEHPETDPYWAAFYNALQKNWK